MRKSVVLCDVVSLAGKNIHFDTLVLPVVANAKRKHPHAARCLSEAALRIYEAYADRERRELPYVRINPGTDIDAI